VKRILVQLLDNGTIDIVEARPPDPWEIFDCLSSRSVLPHPLGYRRLNERILGVYPDESVVDLPCAAALQHQKSDDTMLLNFFGMRAFSLPAVCTSLPAT
jgi:hypothetical protein